MMTGGATTDPMEVPLLKMAMPRARWRMGNHSAMTLAAPGQLPASPRPSRKRKQFRLKRPVAKAWSMLATDQTTIEMLKPRRLPTRS